MARDLEPWHKIMILGGVTLAPAAIVAFNGARALDGILSTVPVRPLLYMLFGVMFSGLGLGITVTAWGMGSPLPDDPDGPDGPGDGTDGT
jgi:H+/Cl- antiporter ClcA